MREQLIQAIEDDPDDVESYRVYADWLESNGQPRGQLIAMELLLARLTDRAKREHLTRKIKAYFAEHRRTFVGSLRSWANEHGDTPELIWRYGFIHRARLMTWYDDKRDQEARLREVLASPSGRFLVELELGAGPPGPVLDTLLARVPASLRHLFVEHPGFDFSGAWPRLARLTHLSLRAKDLQLGSVDLPNLTSMRCLADFVPALLHARTPRLAILHVEQGQRAHDVLELLDTLDAPMCTKLILTHMSGADEIVLGLASTRTGGQIVELALESSIDDELAHRWAKQPPPRRLARLDVRDNYRLSRQGIAALRKVAERVLSRDDA